MRSFVLAVLVTASCQRSQAPQHSWVFYCTNDLDAARQQLAATDPVFAKGKFGGAGWTLSFEVIASESAHSELYAVHVSELDRPGKPTPWRPGSISDCNKVDGCDHELIARSSDHFSAMIESSAPRRDRFLAMFRPAVDRCLQRTP